MMPTKMRILEGVSSESLLCANSRSDKAVLAVRRRVEA